ncbi:MAG: RlmE family RNA methyltransferase [Candidatus Thermoplasmatota archaeon]|nr:RlmE family RNA methyltransferase [Candidatus Thermoplasmatota archaeon]
MTRWYQEKKREHYYKLAKREGYRARSSYKLKQIQQRFHVFEEGNVVVDLGAAPGGWSQIAKEYVGVDGVVIGIDLQSIAPLDGICFIQGDITKHSSLEAIKEVLQKRDVDVVLSDMAPNISGQYSMDHAKSIFLAEQSITIVESLLRKNGNYVCKVFMGDLLDGFVDSLYTYFSIVKRFTPSASRKSSSEIYIICKYYKN